MTLLENRPCRPFDSIRVVKAIRAIAVLSAAAALCQAAQTMTVSAEPASVCVFEAGFSIKGPTYATPSLALASVLHASVIGQRLPLKGWHWVRRSGRNGGLAVAGDFKTQGYTVTVGRVGKRFRVITATGPCSTASSPRSPQVTVLNLVGQSLPQAEGGIRGQGLRYTVSQDTSSAVPRGEITRQAPAPGSLVERGSTIEIWVSPGPGPATTRS